MSCTQYSSRLLKLALFTHLKHNDCPLDPRGSSPWLIPTWKQRGRSWNPELTLLERCTPMTSCASVRYLFIYFPYSRQKQPGHRNTSFQTTHHSKRDVVTSKPDVACGLVHVRVLNVVVGPAPALCSAWQAEL